MVGFLVRRALVAAICIVLLVSVGGKVRAQTFLGLTPPSGGPGVFWEGPTDYSFALKPSGQIRAIMLFARFSDSTTEEKTADLYARLAPKAMDFMIHASYGKVALQIDKIDRWIPMDHPSTFPGYKTAEFETQRNLLSEAIHKSASEVDFRKYDIVYVVDSRAPGFPNSPTFGAPAGQGILIQGGEIRHGVTFGNDMRTDRWGWQTLCHETGHIFGLPDLYSFDFTHGYKHIQRYVGFWDLMGYQAVGSEYLAWQKRKLEWLSDDDFVVVTAGTADATITPIYEKGGKKAIVVPIGPAEAYVAEVRSRDGQPGSTMGVLLYRVTLKRAREGHIQIIPAAPDDNIPAMEQRFVTLYNALYQQGVVMNDPSANVRIEIVGQDGNTFRLRVTR